MREVFQQSLQEVQERLVGIAELVEQSITQATAAFGKSDVALAENVLDEAEQIGELVLALDKLASF